MLAWKFFSSRQPNSTHYILQGMQQKSAIQSIITQNVDGLHTKAGSKMVIELHGSNYSVVCLNCNTKSSRNTYQSNLLQNNYQISKALKNDHFTADGDIAIEMDYSKFKIPPCKVCSSTLIKPDLVFFGETIPKVIKQQSEKEILNSDGLLVLGTSLLVFSAYNLVRMAHKNNIPVAIINIGDTRGDKFSYMNINEDCNVVLEELNSDKTAYESTNVH
eukprot:TRINITY_DN1413_c0_g1_i1.p1 TRINITY_DN1413_c0_g1~~TRINITY_DN1413_c0_g1_i1.p1  ORF type:complete len:218 (-),score=25.34 TRINITY_DN1413_c0_g1_i1:1-654(-)